MSQKKEPNPCDICILSEPCDDEAVEGLQYHLYSIRRTSGKNVTLYPPYQNAKKKFVDRAEALEKSHAILIVLSDNATAHFKDEDANNAPFFQLIRRALELEKERKIRILPIFLSQVVRKDGLEGFTKFSNWSYKCKNEEVRTVMDRIGSLQGVFLDPDEEGYEMKFQKLKSFWQEAHQALVPLSTSNLGKELDWELIGSVLLGILIGMPILILPNCLTCFKSSKRKWLFFRKGLLIGNALIIFMFSLALVILGIFQNYNECEYAEPPDVQQCFKDVGKLKNTLFTWGAVGLFVAIVEFAVAHLWASSVVRTEETRESKAKIKARMDSRASKKKVSLKVDVEMNIV